VEQRLIRGKENMEEEKKEIKREDTKNFSCPSCGGNMIFNPEQQCLSCSYCENKIEIKAESNNMVEYDFDSADDLEAQDWGEQKRLFKCENCGAESIFDKDKMAQFCPFCGSSHIAENNDKIGIKPTLIVPFKIKKNDSEEKFKVWIKKRFFAPTDLKKTFKMDKVSGVYLPYWTYDSNTFSNYVVKIGTYYYVTETRWVNENGERKQVSEQVRKTRWRTEHGTYTEFFDDVLCNASSNVESGLVKSIEPFNLKELLDYKAAYLSGFVAERYSISLKNGWNMAKTEIDSRIKSGIRTQVFGDEVRIENVATAFSNITFKHILLPVWISAFDYKGKVYRFMVNGQTGELDGKSPVSALKVTLFILAIIAVIALLLLVI
jgi:predicted RNA-binding Zn-ribbon protein involved in translation (DUF1610 family)